MKKNIYLMTIVIMFTLSAKSQVWIPIISDTTGDGFNPTLLDGTSLDYYYDWNADSIWFNVFVDVINSSHESAFGINVMINIPGAGNTFNFWGANNNDPFHRLITAWVTGSPPSNYSGTIGVSDYAGVNASNYTNLSSNNISIYMDVPSRAITIGLKRSDVIPDSSFTGGNSITIGLAAAVGSNVSWNDDIYAPGITVTITLTTGINNPTTPKEIKVYTIHGSQLLMVELSDYYTIKSRISITDISGKLVKEKESINSETTTFSIADMSSGIYFVTVYKDESKLFEKKIVIE